MIKHKLYFKLKIGKKALIFYIIFRKHNTVLIINSDNLVAYTKMRYNIIKGTRQKKTVT